MRYLYAIEYASRRLLDRGQRALLGKAPITCAEAQPRYRRFGEAFPRMVNSSRGAHAARARTGCFGAIGSRRSQIQLPLSAESGPKIDSLFGPSTRTASLKHASRLIASQARTWAAPRARSPVQSICNRAPAGTLTQAVHSLVFRDRSATGCGCTPAIRATGL